MVSSRRYALVALVVSRKHPLASARSMLQPTTEPQPPETYQAGPSPTIAAVPHDHLAIFGRATTSAAELHTCGYLYGDANQAFTCGGSYFCATYSQYKAFGCCTTTSPCKFPTTCLPLESSAAASGADLSYTLYCSNTASPFCAIVQYADSSFLGYTFQRCATAATTFPIYYHATETASSGTTTNGYTLTTSSTTSTSTTTTTTPPPPPPPPPNSSSTPVGAIVGGVIGGVAGLAILGSAFMLLRRRRKKRAFSPTQQPFVSEYSYASGYPVSSVTESVASTPFQAPGPAYSPSSVGHAHDGQHWSQVHEMPTGPPEREAHELAT
ncbi:uncharacterized protein G6M90_00g105260 [Metarhizium brunneum]|uniref:Uncharacterized protein n=1 Tax=Metarhizium brunneum TaxID=500148 RepID=A0A7D5ZAR4_9HYPO